MNDTEHALVYGIALRAYNAMTDGRATTLRDAMAYGRDRGVYSAHQAQFLRKNHGAVTSQAQVRLTEMLGESLAVGIRGLVAPQPALQMRLAERAVEPARVRVTRLKRLGYGIRIWLYDKIWSDRVVKSRADVGPSIASDLRMIDKCGSTSPMADASRARNYINRKKKP